MNVRIRLSGTADDVHSFTERLKSAGGDFILSVSRDYPLTRYDKESKEISVYITVQEDK